MTHPMNSFAQAEYRVSSLGLCLESISMIYLIPIWSQKYGGSFVLLSYALCSGITFVTLFVLSESIIFLNIPIIIGDPVSILEQIVSHLIYLRNRRDELIEQGFSPYWVSDQYNFCETEVLLWTKFNEEYTNDK